MDTYIFQHMGLGDMILCNGLIRHILEGKSKKDKIYIFSLNRNLKSTRFMYRDEKRINVIGIDENKNIANEVDNIISKVNKKKKIDFIKIGHEFYYPTLNLNLDKEYSWPCDIVFYKQLNIPFKFRFSKSYWKRDHKNEKRVFKKLVKKNKPYAFVHDDKDQNLVINTNNINPKLNIVRNDKSELIFNFRLIMERATELHLMESSFRQIAEVLNTKNIKLYLYKGRSEKAHSTELFNKKRQEWIGTSKKWKIIKDKIRLEEKKKKIFGFF